ncbi:MAG: hypothetical protein KDE27_19520 [Planctomycetes bacterium]|nr:hypothetical protein [Planctomycetota bacterium]
MRKPLLLTVLFLALSACDGFSVRSTRQEGVPPALLGEWRGTWASDGVVGGGDITVRVQEYRDEAVVGVVFDNPCITPQEYALAFVAGGVELRAAGQVVLRAEYNADGALEGIYDCPADTGSWSAARVGDLPDILDLSGEWSGSVEAGTGSGELLLEFGQSVQGGDIRLQATFQLPEYMPLPLPMVGRAEFREDHFDITLTTTVGVLPAVQMMGVGNRDTFAIEDGVILVQGGLLVPFASGVWTAAPTPQ